MLHWFAFGRDARINALLGAGHFLSHFYQLCLPPLFIAWQKAFAVSFAELGLAMAVMAAAAALMQTPMGFLVDRYGARPFLIGGTLLMTLSIAAMGFATVLADRRAGVAVGGRQLGHPSGGLRHPQRVGGSGEIGAILRLSHLCRARRFRGGAAGDGGSGAAAGVARRVAVYRPLGPSR